MNARSFLQGTDSRCPQRVWPLQAVVALVFTFLLVTIAGGLVLYNHAQLTRFAKREAHTNFAHMTRALRNDRQSDRRISELFFDLATTTIDPNVPRAELEKTLLDLMSNTSQTMRSTFGLFVAFPNGSTVGVQDVRRNRPPEIVGLGGDQAVLAVNTTDRVSGSNREAWILYDRNGREVAQAGPFVTDHDPRDRDWYRRATATRATVISSPYAFASSPSTGITLARAMPNRPGIVFGINVTLSDLDRVLADGRKEVPAEWVVFDREGHLVAHPDGAELRQRAKLTPPEFLPRMSDVGSPLLAAMERSFQENGINEDLHITVDGQDFITRFEPVGSAFGDYIVGLSIPESQLMGDAYRIRTVLLGAAGIALLIALFLIFMAARRIVAPLKMASQSLGDLVQLRFGQAPPIQSRIAEVSDLGRAVATLEPVLQNFARYVPFALVRGMVDSTFSTELGGRRQSICVLFSDIEGFTGLAETLDPDVLTRQTSRYFGEIGSAIVHSKGTIDKYIGDAVMAFWNAPDVQDDFVRLACLGVLRASRRIESLNAELRREGAAEMPTRFGLHVGEAVVGNVGSADRMNYTALGHAVNLASRLEGLNRDFGTTILVSEAVVEQAGSGFAFRPVGETVPRGASRPIRLYELMGAWIDDEPELAPQEDESILVLDLGKTRMLPVLEKVP